MEAAVKDFVGVSGVLLFKTFPSAYSNFKVQSFCWEFGVGKAAITVAVMVAVKDEKLDRRCIVDGNQAQENDNGAFCAVFLLLVFHGCSIYFYLHAPLLGPIFPPPWFRSMLGFLNFCSRRAAAIPEGVSAKLVPPGPERPTEVRGFGMLISADCPA